MVLAYTWTNFWAPLADNEDILAYGNSTPDLDNSEHDPKRSLNFPDSELASDSEDDYDGEGRSYTKAMKRHAASLRQTQLQFSTDHDLPGIIICTFPYLSELELETIELVVVKT